MAVIRPERVVIIDIDGLRPDVYHEALKAGALPNFLRMTRAGEHPSVVHLPAVSVAPSITFAAQASIFTGAPPARHRVPGNECFDRLGVISNGKPRHFGFDVGDTLSVDDAIAVFANNLADRLLNPETPTIYERAAAHNKTSLVAHNMYARGAQSVIRPNLMDIARFTKGRGILGLEAAEYDGHMLTELLAALHKASPPPDLITAYFMGLDHHSHHHGPDSQEGYLVHTVDRQVGLLVDALEDLHLLEGALFVIVSDHGQLSTPGDDAHSIRLGFPFDRELTPLFRALGLDLHDTPGEGPQVDAVVGLNGGLAQVYLRHPQNSWHSAPRYEDDVLRVAQAFFDVNEAGRYRSELQGLLELILVRDAESTGWEGGYRAYLGDGQTQEFEAWLEAHPELPYLDAASRIRLASGPMSGDLILAARAGAGVYFGGEGLSGVHGSLHEGDSAAVLGMALPGVTHNEYAALHDQVHEVVARRCEADGGREPSIMDASALIASLWLDEQF